MQKQIEFNSIFKRESEITKKYFHFFKFFNFTYFKDLSLKKKISYEVDLLLYNKELEKLTLVMEQGYKLNHKQKILFINQTLELFYNDNLTKVQNILSNDSSSLDEIYFYLFLTKKIQSRFGKMFYLEKQEFITQVCSMIEFRNDYVNETEEISAILKKNLLELLENIYDRVNLDKKSLINLWISCIEYTKIKQPEKCWNKFEYYDSFCYFKDYLFTNATNKQINTLKKIVKNSSNLDNSFNYKARVQLWKDLSMFKESIKRKDVDNFELLLEKTKNVYLKDEAEKLFINDNIKFQNLESLQLSSQDILNQIENLYSYIKKNEKDLSSDEKINVERFITKRIPEIIELYYSLPEEKKTVIDSENKQTVDLVNDSLNNVKEYFENIYNNIANSKKEKLKTINNYTKNFTK